MKTNTITSLEIDEICRKQSKNGKIEVAQTASDALRQTPLGHSNDNARPRISDDAKCTTAPKSQKGGAATMKDEFSSGNVPKRIVEIDAAKYQKYLDDPSLNDEQREQIIKALWSIITAFVDLGFGVHPMQEVIGDEACGQLTVEVDQCGDTDSNDPKPATKTLQGRSLYTLWYKQTSYVYTWYVSFEVLI